MTAPTAYAVEGAQLPRPVADVCRTFLVAVPPGLVTGLYLRGGIGFGEWVPGRSDIDFVATLAARPTSEDVTALRQAHEQVRAVHRDLPFDGMHVLVDDLAADPRIMPGVPVVLGHEWDSEGVLDAEVTWHELAWHGVTVSGPPLSTLEIWSQKDFLLDFTRNNLDTYWRAKAGALTEQPPEGCTEWACEWCVLGTARLHHVLATGRMTTKTRAGEWGLTYYPSRFHRVLREALRIRNGGHAEYLDDDGTRGTDTADFTAYVVAEATSGR